MSRPLVSPHDGLVVDEASLGSRRELPSGKGSEGTIFELEDFRLPDTNYDLVYKQYADRTRSATALLQLVAIRDRLTALQRSHLDELTVWPLRSVVADGRASGVIMRRLPEQYWANIKRRLGGTRAAPREVQHLFVERSTNERSGIAHLDRHQRYVICRDFAMAFWLFQMIDVVYGDLSARNAVYRDQPHPAVILLDCDSCRVHGSSDAPRQPHTPDWHPPEAAKSQSTATDRYKLGLMILRILSPGQQASTSHDPSRARTALDDDGMALLAASLGPPATRPTAFTWYTYFKRHVGPHVPRGRLVSVSPGGMTDVRELILARRFSEVARLVAAGDVDVDGWTIRACAHALLTADVAGRRTQATSDGLVVEWTWPDSAFANAAVVRFGAPGHEVVTQVVDRANAESSRLHYRGGRDFASGFATVNLAVRPAGAGEPIVQSGSMRSIIGITEPGTGVYREDAVADDDSTREPVRRGRHQTNAPRDLKPIWFRQGETRIEPPYVASEALDLEHTISRPTQRSAWPTDPRSGLLGRFRALPKTRIGIVIAPTIAVVITLALALIWRL